MPLNLPRIAAALNAYPWTLGCLTERASGPPTYCAIGALLRYAGVPQDRIACAAGAFWILYAPLLRSEYGIADETTVQRIIAANDGADSQAEAIERVLGILTEPPDDPAASLALAG